MAMADVSKGRPPRGVQGFTAVELSVSMVLCGVLAALFFPAILKARRLMLSTGCLGQARQWAVALDLYANDHADRFPPNQDGFDVPLGQTWIQGWMGWSGPDCTNLNHLRNSLLAPYAMSVAPWKCPSAGPVRMAHGKVTKVRSYSLNGFLGSPFAPTNATAFRNRSDLGTVSPSRLLAFVEERPETINDGTFTLQRDFQPARPALWTLRDQPAVHHQGSGNLTWVDGHAETHRWLAIPEVALRRSEHPAPRNPDVLWLHQHATGRSHPPGSTMVARP